MNLCEERVFELTWKASKSRGPDAVILAKSCNTCGQFLPALSFSRDVNRKDKLKASCKDCSAWSYKKSMYGVSREMFARILTAQQGGCSFCGVCTPDPKDMHLDHHHGCCPGMSTCGSCIRGILCFACNAQLVSAYERLPAEAQTWDVMNQYLITNFEGERLQLP